MTEPPYPSYPSSGQPQQPPQHPPWAPPPGTPPPPTPGQATTALVLGVLSLTCFGFLTGVPAMVLGKSAEREITRSGGRLGGAGVATAGFVTGLVGTILSTIGLVVLLAAVVLFGVAVDRTITEIGEVEPSPACAQGTDALGDPLLEDCPP
ncbi:DUF4190 domain-containing protein [Nocardioides abyssi]|uniref:DUF4190 domain-containing protein n=1 Tax=Nocardioides abyssi TaxID=3058370 RepID=A0ABT8EQR9_9ACTN|nr:DUF4190 domain-containing protein [Nocardioides abyssi]MDN4160490.1 DUF4190 domain-containing protein [Nocardioides abyssi]